MISATAGKCLDLINALEVLYPHRRPPGVTLKDWKRAVDELVFEVLKQDEAGHLDYQEALLEGLREQIRCFAGEQAVVDMGMTTFAHLEGP